MLETSVKIEPSLQISSAVHRPADTPKLQNCPMQIRNWSYVPIFCPISSFVFQPILCILFMSSQFFSLTERPWYATFPFRTREVSFIRACAFVKNVLSTVSKYRFHFYSIVTAFAALWSMRDLELLSFFFVGEWGKVRLLLLERISLCEASNLEINSFAHVDFSVSAWIWERGGDRGCSANDSSSLSQFPSDDAWLEHRRDSARTISSL